MGRFREGHGLTGQSLIANQWLVEGGPEPSPSSPSGAHPPASPGMVRAGPEVTVPQFAPLGMGCGGLWVDGSHSQEVMRVLTFQELIYKEFFSQGDLVCGE